MIFELSDRRSTEPQGRFYRHLGYRQAATACVFLDEKSIFCKLERVLERKRGIVKDERCCAMVRGLSGIYAKFLEVARKVVR